MSALPETTVGTYSTCAHHPEQYCPEPETCAKAFACLWQPAPDRSASKLLAAIRAAMAELERGQPQRALVILSGAEATYG